FQKFPWGRQPRPDFHHIEVVEAKDCSVEMKEFITQLKSTVISAPTPWLSATPDYLLGEEANWRDTLKGETTRYVIMPLGYVYAKATRPQPDWQSFLLGNVIIHALGGGSGTHVRLQDQYFLRIIGRDRYGKQLTVAFEWLAPGDEGYQEGEYFVRFVNRWL
ncbi:MAG: hypothetical protein H5T63_04710, partial [Chloroflexi bacterium]|nr:hypothetical protein [Chloroflexota bacterium]